MNLKEFNQFKKNLESSDYLEKCNFDKNTLFEDDLETGLRPISLLISKGLLLRAVEVVEKNGEKVSRADFFPQVSSSNPTSVNSLAKIPDLKNLNAAIASHRLGELNSVLKKNGEKIEKQDFLSTGQDIVYSDSMRDITEESSIEKVFQAAPQSRKRFLKEINEILEENQDPFRREDFFTQNEEPKLIAAQMIFAGFFKELCQICDKEQKPITSKEFTTNDVSGTASLLDAIIMGGSSCKDVVGYLKQNNQVINRNNFIQASDALDARIKRGDDFSKPTSLAVNGEIEIVNNYLKENGEKPITILDTYPNEGALFSDNTLEKILGIKSFSDNPKNLNEFWKRTKEELKTPENQEVFNKGLRKAISNTISKSAGTSR